MGYFTKYHFRSDSELYSLFSHQTWNSLNFNSKMAALQELENRAAKAYGNTPRRVVAETMQGSKYGGYNSNDDVIRLNRGLIESGRFTYRDENTGKITDSRKMNSANAELVDTIYHENYHAYQQDVVNGRIQHPDKREAELWRANLERDENGHLVRYCSSDLDYRIQSSERSAWKTGESETRRVFDTIEKENGPDPGYAEYKRDLVKNSYEKKLAEAKAISGNPYYREDLDEGMLKDYAQEHDLPYTRQIPGKEEADHATATNALQNYMNQHNYSPMDYPEYSKDPEWQKLHQDVYGEIDGLNHTALEQTQSPEAREAALHAMSEYMNEHNYSRMHYPEYSKDPEWQRLNNDLLVSDGKDPIDYSENNGDRQDDVTYKSDNEQNHQTDMDRDASEPDQREDRNAGEDKENTESSALGEQPDENELKSQDNISDEQSDEKIDIDWDNDENLTNDERSEEEIGADQNEDSALNELSDEEIDEGQSNAEGNPLNVQNNEGTEEDDEQLNNAENFTPAQEQDNIMDQSLDEHRDNDPAETQNNTMENSLDEQHSNPQAEDNIMDNSLDGQQNSPHSENNAMEDSLDEQHNNPQTEDNIMDNSLDGQQNNPQTENNIMDDSLDDTHNEARTQDKTMMMKRIAIWTIPCNAKGGIQHAIQ